MNFYPNYNQFYNQGMQPLQPMQPIQPMQQMQRPVEQQYTPQPVYKPSITLQGKTVDSVDVVKAMDIPLDGTVSYFPLVDGSAIVTKQLMPDGTSKTITYKPLEEPVNDKQEMPKYLTLDEFNKSIKVLDNSGLKSQIEGLKDQMEDLLNEVKEIKDNNNNYKRK